MSENRNVEEGGEKKFWRRLITHNTMLKILSLVFAVLLWSYVIAIGDPPRTKSVNNVPLNIINVQRLMQEQKLVVKNMSELPSSVSCRVRVKQSEVEYVNMDSVHATMDLANINAPGVQKVRIRGVTDFGYVEEVVPPFIEVDVDAYETLSVPVKVVRQGDAPEDVWVLGQVEATPTRLTISGAASKVSQVAEVRTVFDMSGVEPGANHRSATYLLLDADGKIVDPSGLTALSNITLSLEALPMKNVPIHSDQDSLLIGKVMEGYRIQGVSVKPETIKVAADEETLSRLEYLTVESFSIDGASEPISKTMKIVRPNNVKYMEMDSVNVSVDVQKDIITAQFPNLPIQPINVTEGRKATVEQTATVSITGLRHIVEQIRVEDIEVTVNCSYLSVGMHSLYNELEAHLPDVDVKTTVEPTRVDVKVE